MDFLVKLKQRYIRKREKNELSSRCKIVAGLLPTKAPTAASSMVFETDARFVISSYRKKVCNMLFIDLLKKVRADEVT